MSSIVIKSIAWLFVDLAVAMVALYGCTYTLIFVSEHFVLPRLVLLICFSASWSLATFALFWGFYLILCRRLPGLRQ